MSTLSYLNLDELRLSRNACQKKIHKYASIVAGQKERLKWINKYIGEKTDVPTPQNCMLSKIAKLEVEIGILKKESIENGNT